jgi:hypothetical protein
MHGTCIKVASIHEMCIFHAGAQFESSRVHMVSSIAVAQLHAWQFDATPPPSKIREHPYYALLTWYLPDNYFEFYGVVNVHNIQCAHVAARAHPRELD